MAAPLCKKTAPAEAELILYGYVGDYAEIDARAVRAELKALGTIDTLHVRLNSEGGSIFEGLAVYNTLRSHAARVVMHVDGIALSMASVILMAGDEIVMADGAMLMIHNPLWMAAGESDDLRQTADVMDKLKEQLVGIYTRRTGKAADEVAAWMDAETWFTAEEAIAAGFADRTEERMAIAAALDPAKFQNMPAHLATPPAPSSQLPTSNSQLPTPEEKPPMANENPNQPSAPQGPQPAAYADLKAAFPNAPAEFITGQLDAQATLDQARAAWQRSLEERATAAEAKATALEAKAAEAAEAAKNAAGKGIGVDGLRDGTPAGGKAGDAPDFDGDPVATFNERVRETMKLRGCPRRDASLAVAKSDRQLHQAYLAATNSANDRVQTLIRERFQMA